MNIMNDEEYINELIAKIKTLEAKVKRLQQAKLDKFAGQAMQGFCANPRQYLIEYPHEEMAQMAVKQAQALIEALNEGKGSDE